jgi:ATP-binding cassette subfamily G (WHITE) protein 2 (PDR)
MAMPSAGVWGAIPQADGMVEKAEEAIDDEAHRLGLTHHEPSSSDSSALSLKRRQSLTGGQFDDDDEEARQHRVTALARRFTGLSQTQSHDGSINPFLGDVRDPQLDPFSGKFAVRKWVQHMIGLSSRDPDKYPGRTAGVSFRNLNVHGFGSPTDYQKTFGNYPLELASIYNKLRGQKQTKIQILRDFDGLVKSGEMLVVLGRPGSGCSTLLKTISGETHGFNIDQASTINYQGIPMKTMHKDFRGECIYQAEVDVHFPQLTVGQTLKFAAEARAPRNRLPGVSREQYAEHMRDVIMAVFGLSHTINTKVGNDFIRGVSGGERKRVSIAEAALGRSPLQCWDNSTRGLDSATALEFVKTLKVSTSLSGATACVAIYQASQAIYDIFDKAVVLYEGRQIYFGNAIRAKQFFIDMGFECPERATTADFLTSLTSPGERRARSGFEGRVPRTPDEFAARWKDSEDRVQLLREMDTFDHENPIGEESVSKFQHSRRAEQAKHQRARSPYTISIPMQIKLCVGRGFMRLRGDMSLFLSGIIGNTIMALIIGSVFYNLADDTASFYSRAALLFFAILLNAFSSALEILTIYAQRPIVEKQSKYAFYHPSSEALASMICDLPNKILTSITFNLTLYFMTNLRRTPSAFFIFYLFSFTCVLAMSSIFRMIGAFSKSLAQALAPAAVLILALVIYTGFAIPTRDMHPWFRWLNYLDPVAYAFEALMINEFRGRNFPCSTFVPMGPGYANVTPEQQICSVTGAVAAVDFVNGDRYINTTFQYYSKDLWRNYGILVALAIFGTVCYLYAAETITAAKSKGEVLLFRRGQVPAFEKRDDVEAMSEDRATTQVLASDGGELKRHETEVPATIQKQTAVFHWDGVCYDIKIKKENRRLLNEVDGWVKPGTLTALMGASGAGKTTLLDVLASRTTMGIISGEMLVDGKLRNSGFQRKTGYVQQQDLHLATSTVREALNFSALLRQPKDTPKQEKLDYVEEVIKLLEMEAYADAIVGVPGEGLNVEQRKRLTIAVEMAAKPALLLFLDEPTSGLDSQTAWSILMLLKKLAANGQAILCTIHQPSALLFQEFDRLLFLASGGRTVYYGDIGDRSKILTSYFERHGSRSCEPEENPAEWMLDVIGAAPGSQNTIDWPTVWYDSPERQEIKRQLADLKEELSDKPEDNDPKALREFAAPFGQQLTEVTTRVFEQYWRTPSYLYSKAVLCISSSLFIGFSFWMAPTSLQGLQNQLFAIFMCKQSI